MEQTSKKLLEALKDFSPTTDVEEELRKEELRLEQEKKRERSFWKKRSKIFN